MTMSTAQPVYRLSAMSDAEQQRLSIAAQLFIDFELDKLSRHLSPGQRIADIGCGTGEVTRAIALQQPTCSVIGFDTDPLSLELSQLNAQGVSNFECHPWALGSDEPPVGAPFDVIFVRLVLIHNPNACDAIQTLRQYLTPTGRLYLVDVDDRDFLFNPAQPWHAELMALFQQIHLQSNSSRQLGRELGQYLTDSGFEDVQTEKVVYTTQDDRYQKYKPLILPIIEFYLDTAEAKGMDTKHLRQWSYDFCHDPTTSIEAGFWHATGTLPASS